MAKRKNGRRTSGHPGRRAAQNATSERPLDPSPADPSSLVDDAAHAALTSRGWRALGPTRVPADEDDASENDTWEWSPSQEAPDGAAEIYWEPTTVTPADSAAALVVDLAASADGPFAGALYTGLDDLLADIDALEGYRAADQVIELPHARERIAGLQTPLSVTEHLSLEPQRIDIS